MVLIQSSVTESQPPGLTGSLTSFEEEDIEGGVGYSSSDSVSSDEDAKPIVAKSISFGNYIRRKSQEVNMHRRRSVDACSSSNDSPQCTSRRSSCDEFRSGTVEAPSSGNGFKISVNHMPKTISFRDDVTFVSAAGRKSSVGPSRLKRISSILIAASVAALTISQFSKIRTLEREVSTLHETRVSLEQSKESLLHDLHNANKSLHAMKRSHGELHKANEEMNDHIKGLHDYVKSGSTERGKSLEKAAVAEREAELTKGRYDKLVESIQSRSRQRVVEKYGPGPHRVEMEVQLPSSSATSAITIELAPLNLMPHSVQTFLDQVDQKAWDGSHFNLHVGHVLMAQPKNGAQKAEGVGSAPKVLFPEFSDEFPHDKYTVAFPGRPGSGQEFYINLQQNIPYHSPRIREDGTFAEGEPCFGKIVDALGKQVVDEMDALSMGKNGYLKESVVIKSARIV